MIEKRGTCPLCKKTMLLSVLGKHIELERRVIRDYTMKHIRASHPGWVAADGDCPKCQDFYDRL